MSRYAGMTIGERLYAAGLFEPFCAAVTKRDRQKMFEFLSTIRVSDPGKTIELCLLNPHGWARSGL